MPSLTCSLHALFQDFRNYRYSLPMVPGLTVDLEAQRTCIKIPTTGYNDVRGAFIYLIGILLMFMFDISHHPRPMSPPS